jgi:subtilisin family serine protease/subtilisin-like proprotein convertase family protein
MSASPEVYTYRGGEKINLTKLPDQFIVRALPGQLEQLGIQGSEQLSSASSRVRVHPDELEQQMSHSRTLAPTYHAYHVAGTTEDFLISDRIFVTFKQVMSSTAIARFAQQYGLVQREQYGDRDYLFQLTTQTGMNPVKLVARLSEQEPQVELAENDLNHQMHCRQVSTPLALPDDPEYKGQWHLHQHFSDPAYDPRSSARCEQAWQQLQNFGSGDVVVGVTDDGCKLDHPDFNDADLNDTEKFADWGYFVGKQLLTRSQGDGEPEAMYEAGNDHGTACAGVIAAAVNSSLTVGAAPGCRLLPIKWQALEGGGLAISDSRMLTMLNYVADKVDVLSNSWGSVPNNLWSQVVVNRVKALGRSGGRRGKGIVFLWAAGNENCPIQYRAQVDVPYTSGWKWDPTGKPSWGGVQTDRKFQNNLAGIAGVMHVAALGSTAQRSHYSNYGPGIDICAPSNNLHTYDRLDIPGLEIITTSGGKNPIDREFGGTSSATPLVAGIAALVLSAHPELSALEVISVLKRTASKDLNLEPYPKTPATDFDLDPSWDVSPISPFDRGDFTELGSADGTWSPWFGYGKVDAAAAVAEALRLRQGGGEPPPSTSVQTMTYQSQPRTSIPDRDSNGVADVLEVADAGTIENLKIMLNLKHPVAEDLKVTLTSPDGQVVTLDNRRSRWSALNPRIRRTYTLRTTEELARLLQQPCQGKWTLTVTDVGAKNTGNFNSWKLVLEIRPSAAQAK